MKIGFWGDVYQATSYSVDISEVVIETKDVDFNVVNLDTELASSMLKFLIRI